ncbi:MAG: hypothetical protein ACYCYE_03730 [Clostridia bacterium]
MASQLGKLGVRIRELEDGMEIVGPSVIKGWRSRMFRRSQNCYGNGYMRTVCGGGY